MRWGARVVMVVAVAAVLFPLSGCSAWRPRRRRVSSRDPAASAADSRWTTSGPLGRRRPGRRDHRLAVHHPARRRPRDVPGRAAGYAFAKLPVPVRRLLIALAVGGLTIPIAALVIPQFDQALELGYLDTRLGLIVATARSSRAGAACSSSPTSGTCRATCSRPPRWTARRVACLRDRAAPRGAGGRGRFVLNVFLQWSELLLGLIMLPGGDMSTAIPPWRRSRPNSGPVGR